MARAGRPLLALRAVGNTAVEQISIMVRPNIERMTGYVPGEQPRGGPVVKLNTNEAPYPPAPGVAAAVRAALDGDTLRKYPDPHATAFRRAAAALHGVAPECVMAGNGSDDLLTILTRAFVPEGGTVASPMPSYLLYRTLAEIQGAAFRGVRFNDDWTLPADWPDADITFVANPNSPSGTVLSLAALERLADQLRGPLVIDEAYADFADGTALSLLARPNVIVLRTLSKSYALAGVRFGYCLAHADVVRQLEKVKDSYNCDALSQAAACAALADQAYLRTRIDEVKQTRARLDASLTRLGFETTPSQSNFVWCRHPRFAAKALADQLRERGLLVRYMAYPDWPAGLRISVGSDADIDRLLAALAELVEG